MNEFENTKHFLVIEDLHGKRIIDLQSETCSIGRDPRNTIVLDSSKISRYHAILLRITIPETNSQQFRIVDGDLQGKRSKNGFKVNGNVCLSYDLQDGDRINFTDDIVATYNVATEQNHSNFFPEEADDATCLLSTSNKAKTSSHQTANISPEERHELIRNSLERLASFPELYSEPIIEIDLKGNITYLNPAALQCFPNIKQSKLQHPVLAGIIILLTENDRDFLVREVTVDKQIFEQSIHLISTSQLVRCYLSDITLRKQAELALKKAHDELEHRVEERTLELAGSNKTLKSEIAVRKRVEAEIRLLHSIINSASEAQNAINAIDEALKQVCEYIGWAYGEAWIPNFEQDKFNLCPAYFCKTTELHFFRKISLKYNYPYDTAIPGKVWSTKQPIWIENISTDIETFSPREKIIRRAKFRSALGVPIIADEEAIAVFVFFDFYDRPKNKETLQLLKSVASQLGSSLQKKKSEDALRSSMATNRALLNAIPDWMFRISEIGTIINYKSAKSAKVPLLCTSDFVGKKLDEVLPLEAADTIMDAIIEALATQQVQLCEYQLTIAGETQYYEARIAVNDDDEMIAIVRDITEKKQIEQELRNTLEQEKKLNELKTRFVNMASHDLRTPLASILSSTELLEHYGHKWNEEKKLNHLRRIQTSVKHMTDLLNDVLVLGKADAGKLELNPTEVNLLQFCQELVEEMQMTTKTHQIIFRTNGDLEANGDRILQDKVFQEQCPNAYLDEKLLRYILQNLLSNAIKYSPNSDKVNFNLSCEPKQAIFQIKDFGIGVPLAEQDKLFESFHRCNNVGSIPGTGLGLPIVKRAVDLHGGSISIKSEVGLGTTFIVTLPY